MREGLQPVSEHHTKKIGEATAQYHKAVSHISDQLAARGITQDTAETFRLGYVNNPIPGHEKYAGWLTIPYMQPTLDGKTRVIDIRFRCARKHDCKQHKHGKYQTLPGSLVKIFNLPVLAENHPVMHICEGEFDAMILSQEGYPAIAVPGAQTWQPHWTRLLHGYNTVYVWSDPDQAGDDMADMICDMLHSAIRVPLDVGDVTETFCAQGHAGLTGALNKC